MATTLHKQAHITQPASGLTFAIWPGAVVVDVVLHGGCGGSSTVDGAFIVAVLAVAADIDVVTSCCRCCCCL